MRTRLTISLTCLLGLLVVPLSGCAQTGCQDSFRCSYATDSATDTDATTDATDSDTSDTTDTGPEQPMPSQGFWGYTRTYDDTEGTTMPISRLICAATEAQLADPLNPPPPEDMICVTSAEDGSYGLEVPDGTYALCAVTCDSCFFAITAGVVVERSWEAGPGGGIFEPTCPNP